MAEPDLITQVLTHWGFWTTLMLVVVLLIITKLKEQKLRPEEKPWFGETVRKEKMQRKLNDRAETFGKRTKLKMFKDFQFIGNIFSIEPIYRTQYKKVTEIKNEKKVTRYKPTDQQYLMYNIAFYKSGLWAWVKGFILHKFDHLIVEPEIITIDKKNKWAVIDDKAFLIELDGIYVYSKKEIIRQLDDFIFHSERSNLMGYVSDTPRRISNLQPSNASINERLVLQSDLEEKAKSSRIKRWVGGN